MANLYTKTGDKGETSLYGGKRVKKSSAKVDCYGTIDEANSMLGLAYSQLKDENIKLYVNSIQKRLFSVGAELASDENGLDMLQGKISEKDVSFLEDIVDECTKVVGKQTSFVVPGKNPASASLHVARTIIRRAERKIISLKDEEPVRDALLKYVNRLSDAIYALARVEEYNSEVEVIKNKVVKKLKAKFSKDFNLANIKKMAEFAEKKAIEINVPMVFSAVDEGGNIILVHRMENSLLASLDISQNKAYTALSLKMPTSDLTDLAKESGSLYGIQSSNDNRIVIFGGGFPIEVNGKIVGAIGVSGGTVEEDMEIAQYAINSLMNSL
ncbi:cob(I)yrinic acid a,c-diamide adenosyltransferase [Romboutsia sp. 1001713B170207_170306_H8]|uniref:cob(I)yrinic acid a,c-diamide adenosyltransferase n=1 Tax=Romboutsia sp. 1001713B170207_170306_H8 TaxID=2787112 RepID=UPI00082081B0|nr:cob(I)yrinic acid a,c-diamide adenosyltransferase [Romboutsia sp. 1001713B170207_170306_H8]SCI25128.1 Cob(I)yrinic acid a%2Cc-diamide adenosyltransferase [uncultured Clostridium sp.]